MTQNFFEQGWATPEELKKALDIPHIKGTTLARLIEHGAQLTQEQTLKFISYKISVSQVCNLKTLDLCKDLCEMIPKEVALEHEIVPVQILEDLLVVAKEDVYDVDALKTLQEITGLKVYIIKAKKQQILEAIEVLYSPSEIVSKTPEQIPRQLLKPVSILTMPAGIKQEPTPEVKKEIPTPQVEAEKPPTKKQIPELPQKVEVPAVKEEIPKLPPKVEKPSPKEARVMKANPLTALQEKEVLGSPAVKVFQEFIKDIQKSDTPAKPIPM
jgi:hypothetical protein